MENPIVVDAGNAMLSKDILDLVLAELGPDCQPTSIDLNPAQLVAWEEIGFVTVNVIRIPLPPDAQPLRMPEITKTVRDIPVNESLTASPTALLFKKQDEVVATIQNLAVPKGWEN